MISLEKELHPRSQPSFKITTSVHDAYEVSFQIPAELSYFKGHFPDFPVLPAVGLLDITSYFTLKAFGLPVQTRLEKVFQVKIAAGLQPGQEIQIQISRLPDATFKVVWLTKDQSKAAELSFSYLHQPAFPPADKHPVKSEFS